MSARTYASALRFEVGPNPDGAEIDHDSLRYEGLRFRAECRLAGKPYGQPFGVDVVFGEPMLGEPEERVADDVLGFAGILPPRLQIYPIGTHIAEKLHGLTMPIARRLHAPSTGARQPLRRRSPTRSR